MSKRCEFCGKNRPTASTTFFGYYCKECIEILIEQAKEALQIIKKKP